jgi:hypothetical protein
MPDRPVTRGISRAYTSLVMAILAYPSTLGGHMQRRALGQRQRGTRVAQLVWMPVAESGPLASLRSVT